MRGTGLVRVLALETSGRNGSIAILNGLTDGTTQIVGQAELSDGQRAAESLLPMIGGLLDQVDWQPGSVQLVSVATGPGSFTGLRMGVTTAKTFAYAAGAKLVAIHTLAALAWPVCSISGQQGASRRLWSILNAHRHELFVACFEQAGIPGQNPPTRVMGIPAWLAQLQPGDSVVGPPLEKLASQLPTGVEAAAKRWWQPGAVAVGQLGVPLAVQSKQVDPMQLVPQYFRKSAAEEKYQ